MIMICERCYAPVGDGEPVLRLAHIDGAGRDGAVTWVHSYVHTRPCTAPSPAPSPAPRARPDTGEWDPTRGIGSRRP